MTDYKGLYQNKKLSFPLTCEISLQQDSLIVHLADGNDREWFYGLIRRERSKTGSIRLVYKNNQRETIDIREEKIIHEIKQRAPYTEINVLKPWWKTANGLYVLLATKFGLIATGAIIYFFVVPFIIDIAVNKISIETEKNLGAKIKDGFFTEGPVDTMKTKLANEFLHALSLPGAYDIHVSVLKSKEKNAFALPGGEIMIYSGIFDEMEDYPEFVALLGHEIGHIEKRHSLKLLCRQTSSSVVLMVAVGNFSRVTSVLFRNANMFNQLSYSRQYETEADQYGLDFMEKNRVDQKGMVKLFEHLKKSENQKMNIQFLSTHPLLEKRIGDVLKTIHEKKNSFSENETLVATWRELKEVK